MAAPLSALAIRKTLGAHLASPVRMPAAWRPASSVRRPSGSAPWEGPSPLGKRAREISDLAEARNVTQCLDELADPLPLLADAFHNDFAGRLGRRSLGLLDACAANSAAINVKPTMGVSATLFAPFGAGVEDKPMPAPKDRQRIMAGRITHPAMREEIMAGELAIVLSGGGAKGAFQVGVLEELIVNRGVKVDIAVGTSTGSIQALAVAQDDIPQLVQFWSSLKKNSDIYEKRPLGIASALLGSKSIYKASGLKKLLKDAADDDRLRSTGKLRLGVVNLGTGVFRTIDETVPGIQNWVYASCAMPVFFEPLKTPRCRRDGGAMGRRRGARCDSALLGDGA